MQVQDQVVIITGASAGIGLATARQFAAAGAKLALAARSADKITQLADELRREGHEALAVPTDMRDKSQVERLIDETIRRFGRIDILINNAGQAAAGGIEDMSMDDYRQIIDLNIFGPLYAMQAAIPHMRQNGGGIIINVSSMVSKMNIPRLAAYASTKAALNMLSDTARAELAPDHIRVITVYPRVTATDFGRNSLGNRQVRQHQRAGRPGMPDPDSPELVAAKILEAAQNEPPEQYMDK